MFEEQWFQVAIAIFASFVPLVTISQSRNEINEKRFYLSKDFKARTRNLSDLTVSYEAKLVGLDLLLSTMGLSLSFIAILMFFRKADITFMYSIARIAILTSAFLLGLFPFLLRIAKGVKPNDKLGEFVSVCIINATGASALSIIIFLLVKYLIEIGSGV